MTSTTFSGKGLSLHSQLVPFFSSGQEQSQDISKYTNHKATSESAKPVLETRQQVSLAARKSSDFWKKQGINFISLITGVVVTGRLGIEGWAAIPASLLAADATRRLIEYIVLPEKSAALNQNSDTANRASKIAYSIVHAIPGRIRLNVPRIAQDLEYTQRLEKLLKADAIVTSIRVSRNAASIVIKYHADAIPVSHWVSLLQLAGQANSLRINCPLEVLAAQASASTNFTQVKAQLPLLEPLSTASCTTELTPAGCTEVKNQPSLSEPASPTSVAIGSTTVMPQPTLEVASPWAELKPPALAFCLAYMVQLPTHRSTPVISAAKLQQLAQIPQSSLRWCYRLANRVAARVSHLTRLRQMARDAVVAIRSQQTSI
jgi:hypothetical protein